MKTADSASLQAATYQRLRQWLTLGSVVRVQRLKIRVLAAELTVGEMPVRAALRRLAAEGAATNVPNAGVAVPKLSRSELDNVLATFPPPTAPWLGGCHSARKRPSPPP